MDFLIAVLGFISISFVVCVIYFLIVGPVKQ